NNNPTNSRTVSIAVLETVDRFSTNYTNARYVTAFSSASQVIAANTSISFFYGTFGASHVALLFQNESGTAGGVPDTADIFVSQASTCVNNASSSVAPTQPGAILVSTGTQWTITSSPASG